MSPSRGKNDLGRTSPSGPYLRISSTQNASRTSSSVTTRISPKRITLRYASPVSHSNRPYAKIPSCSSTSKHARASPSTFSRRCPRARAWCKKTSPSITTYSSGTQYGYPSAPIVASRPLNPHRKNSVASESLIARSERRIRGLLMRSRRGDRRARRRRRREHHARHPLRRLRRDEVPALRARRQRAVEEQIELLRDGLGIARAR